MTTSKKSVVWGALKNAPLLLLLLLVAVTCLARARPVKAAEKGYQAFCWETRLEFKS